MEVTELLPLKCHSPLDFSKLNSHRFVYTTIMDFLLFNPIALKTVKTPWSFGHSECSRVKSYKFQLL